LSGVAAQHWSEAQDACPDPHRCPDTSGPDLSAQARLEANIATAAFASGGAALGGALVLWLTAPSPFAMSIVTGRSTVQASFSW
jgi:hypothetical protein